jgi:hypothetical protein
LAVLGANFLKLKVGYLFKKLMEVEVPIFFGKKKLIEAQTEASKIQNINISMLFFQLFPPS